MSDDAHQGNNTSTPLPLDDNRPHSAKSSGPLASNHRLYSSLGFTSLGVRVEGTGPLARERVPFRFTFFKEVNMTSARALPSRALIVVVGFAIAGFLVSMTARPAQATRFAIAYSLGLPHCSSNPGNQCGGN